MADPCGCTTSQRCPYAWQLRADLQALPVDGTEARSAARHQIALAYTRHLEATDAYTHQYTGLLWPIWHDKTFGEQ